ncbi:amidase signature domain-containing protein [Bombardia bombarda]|uniref:Glutamyl-tRNA(Gln) amidotransferase subunit A, mitochondrial n=1 Tax=Bombardia bombarda TaxID=252184 RepID=A0AA39X7M7_9PEZI|nr:amidase signature domain-containing protein [Bombardia bombarda]
MSARTGQLRGSCLRRHVRSSLRSLSSPQQQRRLLNHFISKAPTSHPDEASPTTTENNGDNGAPSPRRFTLAVKDNIATTQSSLPTTCASPFLSTYHSPFEATIVTQLRARGAALVGKTNLDEFGMGSHSTHSAFGAVSQCPDNDSTPTTGQLSAGGSSGGSAVAVATGEADVALGTDTGGSVRLPAAYTGVVGFKPSYGMLSRHGVVPYANSLDTVGLLARSVGALRELVVDSGLWAEHDPKDPTSLSAAARRRCASGKQSYSYYYKQQNKQQEGESSSSSSTPNTLSLKGIKFGIPLEYNIAELDPGIRAAWSAAASHLQHLGARIVPVSLPSTRHALSAYYVIAPAEASSNLAKYDGVRYGLRAADNTTPTTQGENEGGVLYSTTRGLGFGDEVKRRILLGSYTLSSEAMDNYFVQAQKVRRLVRRDFDRVFALDNPLHEGEGAFDLSDLPETVGMENKFGPAEVDFLLCPTAPTVAPRLEDVGGEGKSAVDAYMNDVFTVPASLAGLPAVSVPVRVRGVTAEGTEGVGDMAGLQLIGQYWDDARLLAVAEAVAGSLETVEGR